MKKINEKSKLKIISMLMDGKKKSVIKKETGVSLVTISKIKKDLDMKAMENHTTDLIDAAKEDSKNYKKKNKLQHKFENNVEPLEAIASIHDLSSSDHEVFVQAMVKIRSKLQEDILKVKAEAQKEICRILMELNII